MREVDEMHPSDRVAGPEAFERDRARDAALQAAGYHVVRLTWRQITDEPHAVVAQLAMLIYA